eukprot:3250584-Amphidinium_carterae.1
MTQWLGTLSEISYQRLSASFPLSSIGIDTVAETVARLEYSPTVLEDGIDGFLRSISSAKA